jgi:hypothetical protein
MRALVCRQCGVPIDQTKPPNTRYCTDCVRQRYLDQKRLWQARWRMRARRYDDFRQGLTVDQQRAAAAFSADYSRIILNPEQGGGDELTKRGRCVGRCVQ